MASLPVISIPLGTSSNHSPGVGRLHSHDPAVQDVSPTFSPGVNLPTLALSLVRDPQMSAIHLLGGDDDDDSSVSSSDSGSSSGSDVSFDRLTSQVTNSVPTPKPLGSKGAGNKFDFNVGTSASTATTRHSSFSSSESDARKIIQPLKAVHAGLSGTGEKSPVMYDHNGRRKSGAGLVNPDLGPCALTQHHSHHHHHHRQIEADLLNHRHLVVLSNENANNIARIHIEVDSKAASAMAARTFVDTNTIQVHQRRSSQDHLTPLPAVRRASLTNPQQASPQPQSLSPLHMKAAHVSGLSASSAGNAGGSEGSRVPDYAIGQLKHAGRVIANSTRLMNSGVPERTVGRVECLADLHNSSFNQPRFAQQTVGSLMSIKHAQ